MYFTQDDFRKIEGWLQQRTIKDTQFPIADPLVGSEQVALVQDGKNKLVSLHTLWRKINEMNIPDIYNVSDKSNKYCLSLREAVELIPIDQRKPGLVVTFLDKNKNWNIVQFKGSSIYQWNEYNLWRGLFEGAINNYMYHPDEEDITGLQDGNRKFLKLKDRKYDRATFSGKGRKILRKNLVGSQACSIEDEDNYDNVLSQEDFNEENTVYIIRYDFSIDGKIRVPNGCEILFEGGTLNGGIIDLNGCKLSGMIGPESDYITGSQVSGWALGQLEFRDDDLKYWTGTRWTKVGDVSLDNFYTKDEITNLLEDYAIKSDYYTKEEIENAIKNFITESAVNELISNISQNLTEQITNLTQEIINIKADTLTLNQIQQAINDGCDVDLPLPDNNSNKISLPIWTGTQEEYDAISPKVSGMTYNIIDEE